MRYKVIHFCFYYITNCPITLSCYSGSCLCLYISTEQKYKNQKATSSLKLYLFLKTITVFKNIFFFCRPLQEVLLAIIGCLSKNSSHLIRGKFQKCLKFYQQKQSFQNYGSSHILSLNYFSRAHTSKRHKNRIQEVRSSFLKTLPSLQRSQ